MIPVKPAPEPQGFDRSVRRPGNVFLTRTPHPTGRQWQGKQYWRRALADLIEAYDGICSYCGSWTIRADRSRQRWEDATVDHFVPRSVVPAQAYEWDNFRLCRRRLNEKKGDNQDVLDPFAIGVGWFKINFLTFQLGADPSLPQNQRERVIATIYRLELNDDDQYVNERKNAIKEYSLGRMSLVRLAAYYPFLAFEMQDQQFDLHFLPMMKKYFTTHPDA